MRRAFSVGAGRQDACGFRAIAAGLLSLAVATSATISIACAETFRVRGSTTFNRALMEPFQNLIETASGHKLEIIPNKSANGIVDLLEGRADLAMISAPLATEVALLSKTKPGLNYASLVAHSIAETRVAFAVHPENQVRSASTVDIARVLTGDLKTWAQLGGANIPIRTVFVQTAGGVTTVVSEQILGGGRIAPAQPIAVETPVQVAKIVAQVPGALGIAQLRLVKDYKLGELTTGSTISQSLLLVTKGVPTPAMAAVIKAVYNVAEKKFALVDSVVR